MQVLAWALVAILGVAAVVFLWLWQRAAIGRQAAEDTLNDVQSALAKRGDAGSTTFTDDVIYRILAKGQLNVGGTVHSFGVVQPDAGEPQPFLTATRMEHLVGGDSFSAIRGNLHKVDVGGAAAAPAPAPAPAPAAPSPAAMPEPSPEESFEQLADRTVMFAPSRGAAKANSDPYEGFPYLRVTAGADLGTDFPLPFTNATIGREKSNIIPLSDTGSSRLHCEITYRNNEFILKDANSTNGTLCNGEKITEHVLEFGDSIQVADTSMTFSCDGFEFKDSDPGKAIAAFEKCLEQEPNFLLALKNLAFLLERNVARKKDAEPLWKRVMQIEQRR